MTAVRCLGAHRLLEQASALLQQRPLGVYSRHYEAGLRRRVPLYPSQKVLVCFLFFPQEIAPLKQGVGSYDLQTTQTRAAQVPLLSESRAVRVVCRAFMRGCGFPSVLVKAHCELMLQPAKVLGWKPAAWFVPVDLVHTSSK